jgi:hypothetical protein
LGYWLYNIGGADLMATIINDKDKILQASAIRLGTSSSNFIYFSTPAPVFKVVDTVATPSSYAIEAKFQGQISGTVAWSVVSGTVSSTSGQSGNTWTLAYANMTSDVLVIRATLNYLGGIYTSDLTVTKVFNGADGTIGISPIVIDYSNDSHNVPVNGTGVETWTGSGGVVTIYEGSTALLLDSNTQATTYPTTNGSYRVNITLLSGDTLTEPTITGATTTSCTLGDWAGNLTTVTVYRITAYIRSAAGVTSTLITDATITPSFQGADATVYSITRSIAAIYRSTAGVYNPTTITFSAFSTLGSGTPTAYSGRFIVSTSTDGVSYTNRYTSSVDQSSYTYTILAGVNFVRVRLYLAGGTTVQLDEETTPVVEQGAVGGTGTTGNSARICYTKTTLSSLATTPTTITTTGSTSYPPNGSWGSGTVWQATAPTIVAGESVYQSDGIYSPATNNTVWNVPYLSNLKVGNLQAISTNTGSLTVTGDFKSNTAAISGTTMTGSGGILYANGTFAFGSSTNNITYNGSTVTLNGKFVSAGNFSGGTISGTGWGGTVTIGGSSLPAMVVRRTAGSLEGLQVYESSAISGTTDPLITFDQASNNLQCLEVYNRGTGGGAAKFFNTSTSKQGWISPGAYSFYSPSGGGQIKITDGTAPFTGIHEALINKTEDFEVGDILVDKEVFYKLDISNCLFKCSKSTQVNQVAIGIFNTSSPIVEMSPSALWESYSYEKQTQDSTKEVFGLRLKADYDIDALNSEYKVVSINALGEGQINVCGENGNIAAGDLIVTSSMAGKGMKQSDDLVRSYTVAKARESAVFSNSADIKMIACIYICG